MTYRELLYKAQRLINYGEITLGEYVEMTKPLDEEIEERKQGKWIEVWESERDEFSGEYDEWREHKCSICDFQEMDADRFNFCPNCGAEMRGNEE